MERASAVWWRRRERYLFDVSVESVEGVEMGRGCEWQLRLVRIGGALSLGFGVLSG